MDSQEGVAGVDDAEESVFMGLLAAICQAAVEAQESTATDRFAENYGAHTVMLVNQIAILAPLVRTEIIEASGSTVAELSATADDNHTWANLERVH